MQAPVQRIKTISTYGGLSQFIRECSDKPVAYLARVQVEEIPSPYAYSATKAIWKWNGKEVIWFETRHRRFEVFEVSRALLRFKTERAAEDWHIRFCKPAA